MASMLTSRKGESGSDPRLNPDHQEHKDYVDLIKRINEHYLQQSIEVMDKALDWWELFLAQQEDTRDPVDEKWRSDVFVPLPFTTTRTKAAQVTELIGNSDPIWQVEAAREVGGWFEQSKAYERVLDYVHRCNGWRRFLYKLTTARSVQGTAFWKMVWSKRAHTVTLYTSPEEEARFRKAIEQAITLGAPQPEGMPGSKEFETWRDLVNKSQRFGVIPGSPKSGPTPIIEYQGPQFQYLPMWQVRLDPMIDELIDQKYIIHRIVKPIKYVLDRSDNNPTGGMPYLRRNVEEALSGWDGTVLAQQEQDLAEKLNLNPQKESHPYYEKACELLEVWSPDEKFQYAVIMNQKAVINKRPFERPMLTSTPNILALRNIIVPGHFYGLSDYQEAEKLFTELNSFRRIRMDGATLTTLPVFVKQQGVSFAEAMKKIKPGAIITLPTKDAIQSLIRHALPAEAYREPQEIKMEIEDATEVYSSTKGAPATVGRVTGTEFQGRASMTALKTKVDASMIEEEMMAVPRLIFSFFAQMGSDRLKLDIGGDPSAFTDVSRDQLIEALGIRFRLRGATRNINPDLQVQQLTTAINNFPDALTVQEKREALQLIMGILDIRGYSKVISPEGSSQMAQQQMMQTQTNNAGMASQKDQAEKTSVPVPSTIKAGEAGAAMGGADGQQ
jgi:hypothetical protein